MTDVIRLNVGLLDQRGARLSREVDGESFHVRRRRARAKWDASNIRRLETRKSGASYATTFRGDLDDGGEEIIGKQVEGRKRRIASIEMLTYFIA